MGRYYYFSKQVSKEQADEITKELKEMQDVEQVDITEKHLLMVTKDNEFGEVMGQAVNICSRTAGVELSFENESFDVATCSMSFHHYPNPEKFFLNLNRVLRPGGRFILRDMATNSNLLMWIFNKIEIPVLNKLCKKGDVHCYTKKDIELLCKERGLLLESYEVRKGFRLHCVVRKAKS